MILSAAVAVITAISAVRASLAQSTATLTQIVNQADPGLVWATPAAIPFGTALDASHLNATARTNGSFLYDPAAGAILAPGTHTLSVRFQPGDPNFRPATASTTIQILPPGDSTFNFLLGGFGATLKPVLLRPGKATVVHLLVTPVRDFHQPISFSCGRAPDPLVCTFSPEIIRPTTAPVDVTLEITLTSSRPPSSNSPPPGLPSGGPLLYVPLSLLGGFVLRKGRMLFGILPVSRTAPLDRRLLLLLTAFSVTTTLSGCIWGSNWNHNNGQVLPVTASSLVESRTIDLSYAIFPH